MGKFKRAGEIGRTISRHAADVRSGVALSRAYITTLWTTTDQRVIKVRLKTEQSVIPVEMRLSDVFTLEEVFVQEQYRLHTSLPSTPVIIDAGANIGLSALWFLTRYPQATLYAFEPDPSNFRLLTRNLPSTSSVVAEQTALSDRDGVITLWLAEHGAEHSLVAGSGQRGVQVPTTSLRQYFDRHDIEHVDLLKLDVEGSEMVVLRDLDEAILRIDTIVGELHENMVDPAEFRSLLTERGFRIISYVNYGTENSNVHTFEVTRRKAS